MKFISTPIGSLIVVESEPHTDERGAFMRTFSSRVFAEAGLPGAVVECSVSTNRRAGTLRGLHFQRHPHAESKLVRCTRGRIWDVAVDLRRDSPTQGRWFGLDLYSSSFRALFVPQGCAHGFITLEDDSEVLYQISNAYQPDASAGVRWDDPAFGIEWPTVPLVIAQRDANYPDFDPNRDLL